MGQRGPTSPSSRPFRTSARRHEHDAALPPVPGRRRRLLGEDRGSEFTLEKIETMDIDYEAAMKRRP